MVIKVNTSNTDHSGIHCIGIDKMMTMNTVGLTRLDLVFSNGYANQNSVISFGITSNTADRVIECIFNRVNKCMGGTSGICTLYDEYSNYKCCPDMTSVSVKTRKI